MGQPLAVAPALSAQDLDAWLDGYVPHELARDDIAGAVVVVVKDGQVLLEKGYGYADVAAGRRVDPERTLFRPGSSSKLITWTAVMQQVEQGHIDLDRDVNSYLDFRIPAYRGQPVTMRNLMTHTSGFQDTLRDLVMFDPKAMPPLDRYLKDNLPPRVFPPGKVPAYSNYGVALAGYIVQRVSGEPYDDYIERHIFMPLGMDHATFREPLPTRFSADMSKGYVRASQPPRPYEQFTIRPAGSSAMTAADMAKFMIAHLEDGQYRGQSILRPETVRQMHDFRLTTISPALNRMALGFYETNRNGQTIIGHQGDTVWFHSLLELLPSQHVGIFISLNSVGRDRAAWALRTSLASDFVDRYFPGERPARPLAESVAKAHAALVVGHYDSSWWSPLSFTSLLNLLGQARVTTDGHGHIASSAITERNGAPVQFQEVAPFLWQAIGGQERLAVQVADGKVVAWAVDREAPAIVHPRTPLWRNAAWLLPALIAAMTVSLLTLLFWPIRALVRWRFKAPFPWRGADVVRYRGTAAMAGVSALLMITWFGTVGVMASTFSVRSQLDLWILTLHILSIVVFPLTLVMSGWSAWATWTSRDGAVAARAWSMLLVASSAVLLWVALVYHLIGLARAF